MRNQRNQRPSKKAGLSGLFYFLAVAAALLTVSAEAQPLKVEVSKAEAVYDQRTREHVITITMSEVSRKPFSDFTSSNVGRKIEIRIDGKVVSAPVIREPILGPRFLISGKFSDQDAREIAARISSGVSGVELETAE